MKYPFGKSTRDAFGEILVELGKTNQDIVVLDADLAKSTKTYDFSQQFPERFIQFGIAEANMAGAAAGLATCGKIPVAASFACFLPGRAFDQLRIAVAFSDTNVKLVGTHGGISPGQDGPTQQSVEDIALALALPGVVVLVPSDAKEFRAAFRAAIDHVGPVYLRAGRPQARIVYEEEPAFEIGKADVLRAGDDISIVANGLMVAEALEAADTLAESGIQARVINVTSVRPVDQETLLAAARETKRMIVVEEHLIHGGLAGEVTRVIAQSEPIPIRVIALEGYAESGTTEDLLGKYGLLAKDIEAAAREFLA